MKAITVIENLLENPSCFFSCGIHTFERDVQVELIKYIGDFNVKILPKPGITYFYQWIDVNQKPFMPKPDAILIQGDEDVTMAIYFWQID